MSVLKQEAMKIIETMQEDVMMQVVTYLRAISNQSSKSLERYHTLQSFARIRPENFDYKIELEQAREEKYGRFN